MAIERVKRVEFLNRRKQFFSFGKAILKYVKSGAENVDEDLFKERVAICQTCEYFEGRRCKICGCFVDLKAKWAVQSCPVNNWEKVMEIAEFKQLRVKKMSEMGDTENGYDCEVDSSEVLEVKSRQSPKKASFKRSKVLSSLKW